MEAVGAVAVPVTVEESLRRQEGVVDDVLIVASMADRDDLFSFISPRISCARDLLFSDVPTEADAEDSVALEGGSIGPVETLLDVCDAPSRPSL